MRRSAGLQASLRQLAEQERLPLRRVCLRLVLRPSGSKRQFKAIATARAAFADS